MKHSLTFNHQLSTTTEACSLPTEFFHDVLADVMEAYNKQHPRSVSELIEYALEVMPEEMTRAEVFAFGFILSKAAMKVIKFS